MADRDVISYLELGELAEEMKKDIEKITGNATKVREAIQLVNKDEGSNAWAGPAANAFSSAFFEAFQKLYDITTTLNFYQDRLKKASELYAEADKEAQGYADAIEEPVWAEV